MTINSTKIMQNLTPWQKYQQDLASSGFEHDPQQQIAVEHLQRLYDELVTSQVPPKPWIKRLLSRSSSKSTIQGLYFWGGVGRGKTYLVDTFYECLPIKNKMRIHFHRFMYRVHYELTLLKDVTDPLVIVAKRLAEETQIICFDEFFVSDITDAMLLGGLFEQLFSRGIILVATSNLPPDDLYRNGLQRVRFLPTIALLKQHTQVVNVDSGIDYRLRTLQQAKIYYYPLGLPAERHLEDYFAKLTADNGKADVEISVMGRPLTVRREGDGVAIFEFAVLCESMRSQNDYMELSRCYNTILLANVKVMGAENDDTARRFIALIDEFYERNVKLIIAAQVMMEELYQGGNLSFEFKRCLSRLQEMQSTAYLAKPHLP